MNNEKITNYEIISFQDYDLVVKYVKEGLKNGWQPLGGVQISTYVNAEGMSYCDYAQAMVRYGEAE